VHCYAQVGAPNSVLEDARLPFASNVVWRRIGLVRSLSPPCAINLIGPTCVTGRFAVEQARFERAVEHDNVRRRAALHITGPSVSFD
jgi:hypothetical protein